MQWCCFATRCLSRLLQYADIQMLVLVLLGAPIGCRKSVVLDFVNGLVDETQLRTSVFELFKQVIAK